MHLLSAKKLVHELAADAVTTEQQAQYMLVGFAIWNIAFYSGLIVSGSNVWSLPSVLEGVAVIAINVFGVFQAYEAAGGRDSRSFIVDFTCLYVPVTITTIVPVWAIYWAVRLGFEGLLVSLYESHSQFVVNLHRMGIDFFGLLSLLAVVLVLAVTYWRITSLLRTLRQQRHGS